MEQITLNKALRIKKTLDSRICKAIQNFQGIGLITKGSKVSGTLLNSEGFEADVKAKFQSIKDLIAERDYLENAINRKNMEVTTEIAGKTYTLAEIITIRRNLDTRRDLLNKLKHDYNLTVSDYQERLDSVERDANIMLQKRFETTIDDAKVKNSADALEAYKNYKLLNEPKLIDCLDLGKLILSMEKELDEMGDTLDSRISDLNAVTKIDYETALFRKSDIWEGKF